MAGKKYAAHIVLIALVLVIIAAFLLRFNNLSQETYGYGEIELKQAADEYLRGNFVNNFYIFDTPPFSKYLFAASIAALGSSEFALRIIPLIFGMLTIAAVFFAARRIYNEKVALLAAVITAFSILQIEFSRYAQLETMLSFFYVLTAYFLWEKVHNSKKYTTLLLGVSLGISVAIKFTSLIVVVAVIAYLIYTKEIRFARQPSSITIKNWIWKALAISIIVFSVSWPFGFSTLHTEANVSVDYGGTVREQHIESNIPVMLLSLARRGFTSVGDDIAYPLAMSTPFANYLLLFIVKESLLVLLMLVAGIYFVWKKPMKQDALLAVFIIVFLALLAFQRTSISYRHVTPLVPFFAIITSRWIYGVKKWQYAIAVVAVLMLAYAALTSSYALSYNPLKQPLGIIDSEHRFAEGMRETIDYLRDNCSTVSASNYYAFMIEPYLPVTSGGDCLVVSSGTPSDCSLAKTVSKNSVELIDIYSC